jgi:hypothetical protein
MVFAKTTTVDIETNDSRRSSVNTATGGKRDKDEIETTGKRRRGLTLVGPAETSSKRFRIGIADDIFHSSTKPGTQRLSLKKAALKQEDCLHDPDGAALPVGPAEELLSKINLALVTGAAFAGLVFGYLIKKKR